VEGELPPFLLFLGYFFLLGGAVFFTLLRSWNRILIALAFQSLGLGLVTTQVAHPPVAIAKAIVGWIAVALLALTLSRERREGGEVERPPIRYFFRFSLLLFLFSSLIALIPQLSGVFRNPPAGVAFAACCLIGIGLLNLGLSEHPLHSAASLLTVLQGFELGYLWIEQSLLVLALLAFTDLAMVLVLIILHTYDGAAASPEGRVSQ
jgi:uncharacterized MnhB-related membrane protein